MRTRTILAAGLLTALVAACSRPESDPPPADDAASSPDLALYPPSDETPIASELEAPRPPEPEVAPRPVPVVVRNARPEPLGSAVAALPAEHMATEGDESRGAPAHPRIDETDQVAVAGPAAEPASGGGKPRPTMTEGAGRVPDPGPGRTGPVIIRGGAGGIDDDCALHRPPPEVGDIRPTGGTAVLINERAPRRGPQQVADHTPARGVPSRGMPSRGSGIGRVGIR